MLSMEARIRWTTLMVLVLIASLGASYRTKNFIVNAPSKEFARQVGDMAETYRRDLAMAWLGKEMPNWAEPCPIRVEPGGGAGGATSFMFHHGEVFGWKMQIQGSPERILDSVLPHEVTHTIFASHFRQPLPRWADEGACTTVEHQSERAKQQRMLIQFLRTGRGIAFNRMFAMKEYPSDIMPLYSQGYSLAGFLIQQGGRQKFMQYVKDGLESDGAWSKVTARHYGFENLGRLQQTWLEWVRLGSPAPIPIAMLPRTNASGIALARANQELPRSSAVTVRGQSEDPQPTGNNTSRPSVYMRRGPSATNVSQPLDAVDDKPSSSRGDRPLVPIVRSGNSVATTMETSSDLTLPASHVEGSGSRVAASNASFNSPSDGSSTRAGGELSRAAPPVGNLDRPSAMPSPTVEASPDRDSGDQHSVLAEWNRDKDGVAPPATPSLGGSDRRGVYGAAVRRSGVIRR